MRPIKDVRTAVRELLKIGNMLEFHFYLICNLFPAWWPPFLNSDFRSHRIVFVLLYSSSSLSSKTWVLQFEFQEYSIYKLRYEVFPVCELPYRLSDVRLHSTMFVSLNMSSSSSERLLKPFAFQFFLIYKPIYYVFLVWRSPYRISDFR